MSTSSTFKVLLIAAFSFILFSQCKKDKEGTPDGENSITNEIVIVQNKRLEKVVTTATSTAFLHGNVLDENGSPLSGVEVKSGGKIQTTDKDGYFVFGEVTINKDFAAVKAEKSGYMKGIRTFAPTGGAMNKVEIRLQSRGTAQNIEASNGGELAFDGGKVKLNFPAGSIADADGKAYTGTVKVYARYINPETAGFSSTMPGNLVGLTDDNRLSGMISYGMANVELTDNNGKQLQIAGGKTVKVTMPTIKDAPADMPVWHFNETHGLWVEAGKAVKSGSEYSFEANHFSTWNLDTKVEDAVEKVTITLKSSTNQSLGNQKLDIYTSDFSNRLISVYTDNNGQFTLLQSPRNLGLRIFSECKNLDKSIIINSENETVSLDIDGSIKIYKWRGIAKDCNSPYANSYFTLIGLTESRISFTGKTDGNGAFETSVIACELNTNTKYQVKTIVYTTNNVVKVDTIEVTFTSTNLQKDINFCESEEVINPYLNTALTYGSVTDIDGNKYATIKIGTQTWMAQNLNVSRYNDGTSITYVTDSIQWNNLSTGAYCYFDNSPSNGAVYGKLYNGFALNKGGICPQGWHIPTDIEWTQLVTYLGGDEIAGAKMKAIGNITAGTGLWLSPNIEATNSSGFSGLPAGSRIYEGFDGNNCLWWSSTDITTFIAYEYILYPNNSSIGKTFANKVEGRSCRCIKD